MTETKNVWISETMKRIRQGDLEERPAFILTLDQLEAAIQKGLIPDDQISQLKQELQNKKLVKLNP